MLSASLLVWLLGIAIATFGLRAASQPQRRLLPQRLRGMTLLSAFGYVLSAVLLYQMAVLYFVKEVIFFKWALWGAVFLGVAGVVFRLLGRYVGTTVSKKAFHQMPITAALGILVIVVYAIVSIFAEWIAPYGQAEIFPKVNVLPGGDLQLGGDPNHLLGTDQIGRESDVTPDLWRAKHRRYCIHYDLPCIFHRHHVRFPCCGARRLAGSGIVAYRRYADVDPAAYFCDVTDDHCHCLGWLRAMVVDDLHDHHHRGA